MQQNSFDKLVLGSLVALAGLFLIFFHKEIRERSEEWNERVPWFLRSGSPSGRILTVMIIIFGALLIYAGIAQILSSLAIF